MAGVIQSYTRWPYQCQYEIYQFLEYTLENIIFLKAHTSCIIIYDSFHTRHSPNNASPCLPTTFLNRKKNPSFWIATLISRPHWWHISGVDGCISALRSPRGDVLAPPEGRGPVCRSHMGVSCFGLTKSSRQQPDPNDSVSGRWRSACQRGGPVRGHRPAGLPARTARWYGPLSTPGQRWIRSGSYWPGVYRVLSGDKALRHGSDSTPAVFLFLDL